MTQAVAIRCDASVVIGSGHVMRCLALAEALAARGASPLFICRELPGHLAALIRSRGFAVALLPPPVRPFVPAADAPRHAAWLGVSWAEDAAQTRTVLEAAGAPAAWLVVDSYALDAGWAAALRPAARHILAIDDLDDRPLGADVVLDTGLDTAALRAARGMDSAALLGPRFALLDPLYAALRPQAKVRTAPPRRILVSFGGADTLGVTLTVMEALLALHRPGLEADVVLPRSAPAFAAAQRIAEQCPWMRLSDQVPSLAPLMLAADLAVGAAGGTSWERLCLGLPAAVLTLADNQHPVATALQRRGLARWIGDARTLEPAALRVALAEALDAPAEHDWIGRAQAVVDGRGAERVAAVLTAFRGMVVGLRPAAPADEAIILEWANDRGTRLTAFNPAPIEPADHARWLQARLANRGGCVFLIALTPCGEPFGQVRFDRGDHDVWTISYLVAPTFRGRGLGQPMLEAALTAFRAAKGHKQLRAGVKADNAPSRRIFERLGFEAQVQAPGRIDYVWRAAVEGECNADRGSHNRA
jgi:UDP-2,4-diacetamido-2,4,6-trideoxy-beta-L-altropyranose hydrolase